MRMAAIVALGGALGMAGRPADAQDWCVEAPEYCGSLLRYDTSLTSFSLNGGPFLMPLASDPTNALGDSVQGFGFVRTQVSLSLSSQNGGPASIGKAIALAEPSGLVSGITRFLIDDAIQRDIADFGPIDPNQLHGRPTLVVSFFDVFFDITVTDVDTRPGRNFAGQLDGASFSLRNTVAARMESAAGSDGTLIFDKNAPNFGLLPPPAGDPYIGHFNIEIPLGGDINQNGINDKIKFSLVTHSVGGANRQFITLPDGTVVDSFDSAAALAGAVVDETTDPPFLIGAIDPLTGLPDPSSFGGPVTAMSKLATPMVPEPSQAMLAIIGGVATLFRRRRTS